MPALSARARDEALRLLIFRWEEPVQSREFSRPTCSRVITGPSPSTHAHSLTLAGDVSERRPEVAPALWVLFAEVGGRGVVIAFPRGT